MVLLLPFISLILGAPFLTGFNYHPEVKAPSCTSDALFTHVFTFPPPWAAVLLEILPTIFPLLPTVLSLQMSSSCPAVQSQLQLPSVCYTLWSPALTPFCSVQPDLTWRLYLSRVHSLLLFSSSTCSFPSCHRLSQPTLPPSSSARQDLIYVSPRFQHRLLQPFLNSSGKGWVCSLASPRTTCPHYNSTTA